ncbi:hypothetical protein K7432_003337 [Basidiobolus ranarum]
MKFVPTVPLKRNKKESTPSLLENAMSNKPEVAPTQRRGRGRGRGKGRGKDIISTASGPFSMGPATQGSKGFRGGAESSREILVGSSKNNIPAGSKSYKDKFDSFEYEDSDNEEDSFFVDQNEWTPIMLPTTNTEVKDESVDRLDTLMESHHEQNLSMDVDQEKLKPVHSLLSTITTEQKASTEAGDERLFFFQFPSQFPELEEPTSVTKTEGNETVPMDIEPTNKGSSDVLKLNDSKPGNSAEGLMGKLLIYKSGKMQIKIGDIYLDLNSGLDCSFLQNIVAVDSDNKQAFVMGGVHKRLLCTPSIESLLP